MLDLTDKAGIRAAIPQLRQQGGGRIVQVSSEGGQIAYPSFSIYHATKWGIEGFIESVVQEVAPFGLDFVIVKPAVPHLVGCAPRRWRSMTIRPLVRCDGPLPREALRSRAMPRARSMP